MSIRDTVDLSLPTIMARSQRLFDGLYWSTIAPGVGIVNTTQAFQLGLQWISWGPRRMLLLAAAVFGLILTVIFWQKDEKSAPSRLGVAEFLAGAIWFVLEMISPTALIDYGYAPRLVYLPLAGASITGGALAWMVAGRMRGLLGEQIMLIFAGLTLMVCAVCMVGYARALAVRYSVSQSQVSQMVKNVPSRYLPEQSYIVAVQIDEQLFTGMGQQIFSGKDMIGEALVGVMEYSWELTPAVQTAYKRRDLTTLITTRWETLHIEYQESSPGVLQVQGVTIPLDKTVFYTYRAGKGRAVESVALDNGNGTQLTVRFPIAEKMAADGLPTLKNYPAPQVQEVK